MTVRSNSPGIIGQMAGTERAFVAIIGGFFQLDPSKKDQAKAYARELGAALAKAGFGLVVYFSDDDSLEPHVVTGYVAVLLHDTPAPCIRVRYPEKQKDIVKFAEQQARPALFDPKLMPLDDWEAPFYRSLVEPGGVDAVILMAGNRAVLTAGQIVIARQLPTLALNNFDGSASIIWRELSQTTAGYPTATTSQPPVLVEWLRKQVDARVLGQQRATMREAEYDRLTASNLPTWLTGITGLMLLVILALGIQLKPSVETYALLMFGGLVVAGATGALARTLMWGRTSAVATSLLLGGLAGLLVGIAYLIPQLIGAPGVFNPAAKDVTAPDKIQFISAIVAGFSAGIGFDTVFNRIKEGAKDLPIKPAESK